MLRQILNCLIPIVLFCFLSLNLIAQDYPVIDEQCGTAHMTKWMQEQNILPSDDEFEAWMDRAKAEMDFSQRVVITVPVVVHVIHGGQAVGTYPNITDAQVISQINVLNNDFRRALGTPGYNEHPDGADVEIEFCLAQRDPLGFPTNGINRVNLGNAFDNSALDSSVKPSTIWNPDDYFNMWVVGEISSFFGTILGYAQFPTGSGLQGLAGGATAAGSDGIVIGAEFFGSAAEDDGTFTLSSPYDGGRTTTHEAGHYFGLRHIWGDGGCNEDDFCADTPAADSQSQGCPTGAVACGSVNMVENYMDYSTDYCMNIFTNDQKQRMQTVMANSPRRASLANSMACTPSESFEYSGRVVKAGTSEGVPGATVKISAGGGSFETISDGNGDFALDIVQGNFNFYAGSWGYITKEMANVNISTSSTPLTIELNEGYQDEFVLDLGWVVTGDAETGSWTRGVPLGADYQGVLYDPNQDVQDDLGEECYLTGNSGGQAGGNDVDNGTTILTSPVFDATIFNAPEISLYRWFANGGGEGAAPNDVLEISLTDGTQTVVMESVDASDPALNSWVLSKYNIADYLTPTNSMQVIISTADQLSPNGHLVDAAIDLFRVAEGTVGVDNALAEELGFSLSPNPNDGEFQLTLSHLDGDALVSIYDAVGRQVSYRNVRNGATAFDLKSQPPGVYFVKVEVEDDFFVRKVIVR